jgi:hypothetical protein
VIKYKNDTRYSEECASTHDRQTLKAISCAKLLEIEPCKLADIDVIAIDEGQFFPGASDAYFDHRLADFAACRLC